MGWWGRVKERLRPTTVTEAAPVAAPTPPTAVQVRRAGYEFGIPLASASASQALMGSERQQILTQLHQLYMTCNWVSSCVDVIARTVTAGGVQVVTDSDIPEGERPEDPPEVQRLERLMMFCNPREDMIQLLRNVVTDLILFGDAYLEIVWLLGEPIALYSLDATTMSVLSDEHGEVSGYHQDIDGIRNVDFEPDDVIHFSMDAPRGGLYGVSPVQKVILPATAWLFTMATLKECFRRGCPPRVHAELGHYSDADVQRWREQYMVNNLGPKSVGNPLTTTGGGEINVLAPHQVMDYLETLSRLRDEIVSGIGVPPAKVGIIESGNLGSGTGETQNQSFMVNTVTPVAAIVLEKLNYHLLRVGFRITEYSLKLPEVDYRDSEVIEKIRDMRLQAGAYTLNRWRDEIGEPPVEGGDEAIIVTRQGITRWADMESLMSPASPEPAGAQPGPPVPAANPVDPDDGFPPPEETLREHLNGKLVSA